MSNKCCFAKSVLILGFAAASTNCLAQGGVGAGPVIVPVHEAMLHSPIPVYNRDVLFSNLKLDDPEDFDGAVNDQSPMWGRRSPKIVRVGSYYYTVVPCAARSSSRPGGSGTQYHYDITLYQRHESSSVWMPIWTEEIVAPDDGGFGTRRGYQTPSIVVDNSEQRRLHIVFTAIDGVASPTIPQYPLRHYTFKLDPSGSGELESNSPATDGPSQGHMASRGSHIARWGIAANTRNQYLYLVGTEYGSDWRDSSKCDNGY